MAAADMTDSYQSAPWDWFVAPATALRLPAAALPRWLLVSAGRVWATRSGGGPYDGDVWLDAGGRLELPPGSDWVIEGWPSAQVEVLEAPQRRATAQPSARPAAAFGCAAQPA